MRRSRRRSGRRRTPASSTAGSGRYLAAAAYQLGLTPNQVTAASALCSLAGIVAVATVRPSWWLGVLVAVALALGYALDSADGQLARLRGGGSPAGEWLDHVVDCVKISALHAAVLISLYRFFDLDTPALLLLPLAYQLVNSVAFFAMILNDQLKRVYGAARPVRPPGPGSVGGTLAAGAAHRLRRALPGLRAARERDGVPGRLRRCCWL